MEPDRDISRHEEGAALVAAENVLAADGPQCPVAHAPLQPLPPGHPPTPFASASTLKPPTDPRCVFYRTREDLIQTPPLSRAASVQLEDVQRVIDANRLKPNEAQTLDPDTSVVLASRNSQLALVQTTHVSALLSSHFGTRSPAFLGHEDSVWADSEDTKAGVDKAAHAGTSAAGVATTTTPPLSPPIRPSSELVEEHIAKTKALGVSSPVTFPLTSMTTAGDQNLVSPLYVIGGEGRAIWTKELEVALAAGAVDAIVHSLKDVPTTLPDGLVLGAILEREDPRDALIIKQGLPYKTLDELPPGSVIGTSSVRRVAQLRRRYPELVFSDVRGNLNTRLAKLDSANGPYTALILAAAGLIRLNLAARITAFLSAPVLMHSVGQGSLTIEVRRPPPGATPADNRDARILAMVQSIGDWRATWRQEAERSLLRELEGGCSIPVGVESFFDDHAEVEGVRNEHASVKQVDRDNGDYDETSGPLVQNGHTIPASQLRDRRDEIAGTRGDGPPPLKRLATGQNGGDDVAANPSRPAGVAPPTDSAPRDPVESVKLATSSLLPEDRATEPTMPVFMTLRALVVSLDGKRSSEYTQRREVSSLDGARELGIEVAQELAQRRGARIILDEVERHRQLAEEADERRRRAQKEARVRAAAQKAEENGDVAAAAAARNASSAKDLNAAAAANRAGNPLASNGTHTPDGRESDDERENRRKLEELVRAGSKTPAFVFGKASTADAVPAPHSVAPTAEIDYGSEIDRRGVPRDDGQLKAWEV